MKTIVCVIRNVQFDHALPDLYAHKNIHQNFVIVHGKTLLHS